MAQTAGPAELVHSGTLLGTLGVHTMVPKYPMLPPKKTLYFEQPSLDKVIW